MTEGGIKGLVATFDSFDEVVAEEMVEIIKGIIKNPWEGHHNYRESLTDVDAFLRVHEWYAGGNSHQAFKESIKADYDSLVNLVFPPVNKEALDMNVRDETQGEAPKKSPQSEVPGWEYYQGDLS